MKKLFTGFLAGVLALGTAFGAHAASEITVVSREAGSGTRSAFIELTGIEIKDENGNKVDKTYEDAIIQNGTAQVMTTVAGDQNAIGYISLGSLNDTVKAAAVDGVEISAENVKNGTYPIARPFNIAYRETLSDAAKDFIAFILGADGQALVTANHCVSLEPAPYQMANVSGKVVVGGSSSVAPLMEKLAEQYMALQKNVTIELQVSDSTTGMKGAMDGTFDIGMASRELKESELSSGLNGVAIALDGVAVIINQENPVTTLTTEQIRAIFTGETTDWVMLQ